MTYFDGDLCLLVFTRSRPGRRCEQLVMVHSTLLGKDSQERELALCDNQAFVLTKSNRHKKCGIHSVQLRAVQCLRSLHLRVNFPSFISLALSGPREIFGVSRVHGYLQSTQSAFEKNGQRSRRAI